MARRYRHEKRVSDALRRWFGLEGRLESELAVPPGRLRIDFVAQVGEPEEAWGVLGPDVANREVLIEAYAEQLCEWDLSQVLVKLLGRTRERWPRGAQGKRRRRFGAGESGAGGGGACGSGADEDAKGSRPPLMLAICRRCSDHLLEMEAMRPHRIERGLHRHLLGVPGEVIILETDRLPQVPGVSVLRLLSIQRDEAAREAAQDALAQDQSLSLGLRRRVIGDIMEKQVEADPQEVESAFERALRIGHEGGLKEGMQKGMQKGIQKGMQQGMQQGMQKGIQKGMQQGMRRALLDIARAIPGVPAAKLQALERIEDVDELQARVTGLLRG